MQLSKVLLVVGATSVCLAPLPGRTADKASVAPLVAPTPSSADAVEKARAAMRQKMDELQPAAQAAPQAPAQAAPAPAPAPAQAAAAPSPAPVAEPTAPARPVIPVANPAALEKAREALHEKIAELNSQPAQATTAPKVEQPAVAANKEPRKTEGASKFQDFKLKTTKEVATNPTAKPMPTQVGLTKEPSTPAQAEAAKPKKAKAPEAHAVVAKTSSTFEPLSAPPSPLSATKQQRLNDLLTKYKADQVTPEQYHQERAKILAEP